MPIYKVQTQITIRAEHRVHVPYKAYRWNHMYGIRTRAGGILATILTVRASDGYLCSHTLYGRIRAAYGEYGVCKPLLLSIVHFYLSNFGPSALFGCLRPRIFNSDRLADSDSGNDLSSQQVCRCVQRYLEQCMCDTLAPGLRSTSTCPRKTPQQILLLAPRKTPQIWSAKCKSFGFPRECIIFLTIITTVLGSAFLSSRSSQEETPSKLEPDYVIDCTSNNSFARLNRTIHSLDTSIEVSMVIYWVSCWKMDLFWHLFSVQTVIPVYLPSKLPYLCRTSNARTVYGKGDSWQ